MIQLSPVVGVQEQAPETVTLKEKEPPVAGTVAEVGVSA